MRLDLFLTVKLSQIREIQVDYILKSRYIQDRIQISTVKSGISFFKIGLMQTIFFTWKSEKKYNKMTCIIVM